MKRVMMVMMLVFSTLLAVGCNTIHGAGEDIERGGEKIQEKSDR